MCDTDMVWLKNPLPYLARYPHADLLTSSDQVIPTVTDDSLENWRQGNLPTPSNAAIHFHHPLPTKTDIVVLIFIFIS
jgi:hypothetical protein